MRRRSWTWLAALLLAPSLAEAARTLERLADARASVAPGAPAHLLWTLAPPRIDEPAYAIVGAVSYEAAPPAGYLEMWSHFPDGSRYFSRTLAPAGPMSWLLGKAAPRRFVLPFFKGSGAPPPVQLVVNAVLPGGGTVALTHARLVAYGEGEDPLSPIEAWWDDRAGGLIGAVAGSALGLLGALLGVLLARGRARRFVVGTLVVVLSLGTASLAVGFIALAVAQPFAVTFPLLLFGVLATLPAALGVRLARRRFEEIELRRLQAADAA